MDGKKSLPHLFNDGKPSEMGTTEFFDLIKWLDENDGVITPSNSQINEKLDGSSQFFGYDGRFFWEKFGSDKKFYSEEEIPDYLAGYRQLFSDMKNALEKQFIGMLESDDGQTDEIKAQIEVISSAGSHSPDNYQINLVPYKKSAFNEKGCLSVIQVLWDLQSGLQSDVEEVAECLKDSGYTVLTGYSLSDYKIDLVPEVMEALNFAENYDIEKDKTITKIPVEEFTDVVNLPARYFKKSTIYKFAEELKEKMSNKILSELKGKTGLLSEDGTFEGLAITLDNGMSFKVNSPEFKERFLAHHRAQFTEAKKEKEPKKEPLPKEIAEWFEEGELPVRGKIEANDKSLEDLYFILKKDLSRKLDTTILSWKKAGVINCCDKLTGSQSTIKDAIVDSRKDNMYIIWVPFKGADSRCYATGIYFKDKKGTFATVHDGLNFPQDHQYFIFSLRNHNSKRAGAEETVVQECLQGMACDLAKSYSKDKLVHAIIEKCKKNGFDSVPISGGKIKVSDFSEPVLNQYVGACAKTGIAFINEFSEVVSPKTKTYHLDNDGPLKLLLQIGKPFLNKLPKDCWNPTDILVTDYTNEEIKRMFSNVSSLSDINDIMREMILDNTLGKCFIPLSLKLNTSDERDSVVEKINLETEMEDYHVTSHYVNTTDVGNQIDIYAYINGKSYKFCIRCNGTASPVIEAQHYDTEKYAKGSTKIVDDTTENRDIIDSKDVDIESYRVHEKDNTSSFLGKSKSILFSVIDSKAFKEEAKKVNFDMSNRENYHEGSLPWRLIEIADKIEAMPAGYGKKGNSMGHEPNKAHQVAELARKFAQLIVIMKWSTEEALIYLLTCAMKQNYGAFNNFAPLYKIS